jgi:hypothetical protein
MQAIDVLSVVGGLDSVNKDAVMQFLMGADESGPAAWPIQYDGLYNIRTAFVIVHTASVLGRLQELPTSLVGRIEEVMKTNQNSTSHEVSFWWVNRPYLFETARLLDKSEYVNLTLQRQDIISDIDEHVFKAHLDRRIADICLDVKALEGLQLMETGHRYLGSAVPDTTRYLVEFYILSLWDDVRHGFYESYSYYYPQHYEPSLWHTSSAVQAYFGIRGGTELDYLRVKVGNQYEKLLSFLETCQNQYGVFFDSPGEVDESRTSLDMWTTYYAVVLLEALDQLDFLDEQVRLPT